MNFVLKPLSLNLNKLCFWCNFSMVHFCPICYNEIWEWADFTCAGLGSQHFSKRAGLVHPSVRRRSALRSFSHLEKMHLTFCLDDQFLTLPAELQTLRCQCSGHSSAGAANATNVMGTTAQCCKHCKCFGKHIGYGFNHIIFCSRCFTFNV